MGPYILRSLIRAVITMFLVVTIVFAALRLSPIDPAQFILGDYATAEALQGMRHEMQLDRPLYVQYLNFLNSLFHGDLGRSYINKLEVLPQLLDVLPYTLELVFFGTLAGLLMGVPAGIIAAIKHNSVFDHSLRVFSLVGIAIPVFISGIFLISVFSLWLDLLPAIGGIGKETLKSRVLNLILPAFSCGIWMMASIARLTRAALLDVLKKDYIMTARSKGLRESIVIYKHALRNSILPLITFLGIYINILLGSAVLTEVVFTRPGVGRVIVESIVSGDFPIVQSVIMLYAGAVVVVNLLVDFTYSLVDPRIAYK